jgi:hypothetical protein
MQGHLFRPSTQSDTDSDGDTIMRDHRLTSPVRWQETLLTSPHKSRGDQEQDSNHGESMFGSSHAWPPLNRYLPMPHPHNHMHSDASGSVSLSQFHTSSSIRSHLSNSHSPYHNHLDSPADLFRPMPQASAYNHQTHGEVQPKRHLSMASATQPRFQQPFDHGDTSTIRGSVSEQLIRSEPTTFRRLPPLQVATSQTRSTRQSTSDSPSSTSASARFTDRGSEAHSTRFDRNAVAARLLAQMSQSSRSRDMPRSSYGVATASVDSRLLLSPVSIRTDFSADDHRHTEYGESSRPASTLNDRQFVVPVSRRQVKKASEVKKVKTVPCTACMEEFIPSLLVPGPCSCKYCKDCLNDLFRSGCTNTQSFPPSCHGKPFRINIYGDLLIKDVLDRYKAVELEFSTKKPLYCALPTCSTFIEDKDIVDAGHYGICQACLNCTCTLCRMMLSAHKFTNQTVCPDEPQALKALRSLCKKEMWVCCPSCDTMIEKIDGCDHIACQCGVEFCYVCAAFFNEFDECKCVSGSVSDDGLHDDSFDEEHDEADIIWPQHRRMMDAFGRPRCAHTDTDIMNGDICHGCLTGREDSTNTAWHVHRCVRCLIELCQPCLSSVTNRINMDDPNRLV